MELYLRTRDYLLLTAGVLASILSGLVLDVLFGPSPTINDVIAIELWASAATVAIIGGGFLALVKTSQEWGGAMGRGIQIVGAGTLIEMIIFIPHVHWHLISEKLAMEGGAVVADWFMLSGLWWTGFFHILTAVGFMIIGYGFYLMYVSVKPDIDALE